MHLRKKQWDNTTLSYYAKIVNLLFIVDTEGIIEQLEDEPVETKWNISHYFLIVKEDKAKEKFKYYLKTNCTAYIRMGRKNISEQVVQLSKEMNEKETMKKENLQEHANVIGKLIEKMEKVIRRDIEYIYLKKIYDMVKDTSIGNSEEQAAIKTLREDLIREIFRFKR